MNRFHKLLASNDNVLKKFAFAFINIHILLTRIGGIKSTGKMEIFTFGAYRF